MGDCVDVDFGHLGEERAEEGKDGVDGEAGVHASNVVAYPGEQVGAGAQNMSTKI